MCNWNDNLRRKDAISGLKGAFFVAAMSVMACAHATLGEAPLTGANVHVASANIAAAHVLVSGAQSGSGAAVTTTSSGYSINTVTLESGTVVREFFATANNQVFAVAWQGPALPDLREILGTYFGRFASGGIAASGVHVTGPAQRGFSASDLVIQSYGHIGNFQGYAYLPSAVPPGVVLANLR